MKKLTLLLTAAVLASGLIACSDKSTDTPTALEATELPTIDMVATHDIKLDISVAQLTFVPNSVAPWLGRIILLDDAGHLYSTDIEGREPKPVGSAKYIDIFGLARENTAGVFLAITDTNKIEAFKESDDDGNFSPMIYSGENLSPKTFCFASLPKEFVRVFTSEKTINELDFTIGDTVIEQKITSTTEPTTLSPNCHDNLFNNHTIAVNVNMDNENLNTFWIAPTKSLELHASNVFLDDFGIERGINTKNYKVSINNGLSVQGVEHVKHTNFTTSNYGGGAYAKGVLAFVDADEQRIVFISLSYAKRQMRKAVNLPVQVRQ